MTDKTDSKEREDVDLSRACVKAWNLSGFTSNPMDAVHPMFSAAFELGCRASLAASAGSEPVAAQSRFTNQDGHRNTWTYCSVEHHNMVQEHPDEWPGYETRLLYTHPSPEGMVMVPLKFVQGFSRLAHNYSLRAIPPDYYRGTEGDAFSAAYRRCGQDLAELNAMLPAPPTTSAGSRKGE